MATIRLRMFAWHYWLGEHHHATAESTMTKLQWRYGVHMHMTRKGRVYRRIGTAAACSSSWCQASAEIAGALVEPDDADLTAGDDAC